MEEDIIVFRCYKEDDLVFDIMVFEPEYVENDNTISDTTKTPESIIILFGGLTNPVAIVKKLPINLISVEEIKESIVSFRNIYNATLTKIQIIWKNQKERPPRTDNVEMVEDVDLYMANLMFEELKKEFNLPC